MVLEEEESEAGMLEMTTSGPFLSFDCGEIATLCCDLLFFEEMLSDASSSFDFDKGCAVLFDDFGDFAGSILCVTLFLAPPAPPDDEDDDNTERSEELFEGEGGDSTGNETGRDDFCEKVMCCP